jgi:hypothetical protein
MKAFLWVWTRRFIMIVIPLILVGIESFHPSGFSKNVYHELSHIQDCWGILSKIFIWLFAICYLVFDSIAGVSIGHILIMSNENPSLDLNTVKTIVQNLYNDPLVGGKGSFYSLTGSWAWLLGIASAIVAIYRSNRLEPRRKLIPPLILLAFSAFFLYVGHFAPYGPIAFSCFALASLWFEYFHFGPALLHNLPQS